MESLGLRVHLVREWGGILHAAREHALQAECRAGEQPVRGRQRRGLALGVEH
jgi:hypothetical protein